MTKKQSKRGRPAKLSREQILECALQLLEQGPDKVTISGVARALGAAPMSLYTHVKNRDDLLLGLSNRVLGRVVLDFDPAASWQQQVRSWLAQVHDQLSRYPQVASLLGEAKALSPEWLRIHAVLIRALQKAGFEGAELSSMAVWLGQMAVSDIMINAPEHDQLKPEAVEEAMASVDEADRESFATILPYVVETHSNLFAFMVEQAMARLEQRLAEGK